MFFSREYDYAVRVFRTLANNELLNVKKICEMESIPQPYAYKILKKLEKASILKSYYGARGGYILARPVDEISLLDIYTAIEGEMCLNDCKQHGYKCPNNTDGRVCLFHYELDTITAEIAELLSRRKVSSIIPEEGGEYMPPR